MAVEAFNAKLVATALLEFDGDAGLRDIYRQVERLLPNWPEFYKSAETFHATVRHTIECHCPQSENYKSGETAYFERTARGRYRLVPVSERAAVIARGRRI